MLVQDEKGERGGYRMGKGLFHWPDNSVWEEKYFSWREKKLYFQINTTWQKVPFTIAEVVCRKGPVSREHPIQKRDILVHIV